MRRFTFGSYVNKDELRVLYEFIEMWTGCVKDVKFRFHFLSCNVGLAIYMVLCLRVIDCSFSENTPYNFYNVT